MRTWLGQHAEAREAPEPQRAVCAPEKGLSLTQGPGWVTWGSGGQQETASTGVLVAPWGARHRLQGWGVGFRVERGQPGPLQQWILGVPVSPAAQK